MPHNTDRNSNSNVFNLERNEDGLWLNNNWANPDNHWDPGDQCVFSLRKFYLFPAPGGVFLLLLSKLFFQPQNILPASSNFSAVSSYCLWEINLPSQARDMRNLRISKVKMHPDTF